MSALSHVVAYADNSSHRHGPSPKEHAVIDGTQRKRTLGYSAVTICGRSARLGANPRTFNPESTSACRTCARLVNVTPQR